MRRFILAAVLISGILFVPAVAQADIMDKYNAADEVERVAGRRYHIDPLVLCRQIGSKTFTCSISDFKETCSYRGRGTVRKVGGYTFRVKSIRISKSCF